MSLASCLKRYATCRSNRHVSSTWTSINNRSFSASFSSSATLSLECVPYTVLNILLSFLNWYDFTHVLGTSRHLHHSGVMHCRPTSMSIRTFTLYTATTSTPTTPSVRLHVAKRIAHWRQHIHELILPNTGTDTEWTHTKSDRVSSQFLGSTLRSLRHYSTNGSIFSLSCPLPYSLVRFSTTARLRYQDLVHLPHTLTSLSFGELIHTSSDNVYTNLARFQLTEFSTYAYLESTVCVRLLQRWHHTLTSLAWGATHKLRSGGRGTLLSSRPRLHSLSLYYVRHSHLDFFTTQDIVQRLHVSIDLHNNNNNTIETLEYTLPSLLCLPSLTDLRLERVTVTCAQSVLAKCNVSRLRRLHLTLTTCCVSGDMWQRLQSFNLLEELHLTHHTIETNLLPCLRRYPKIISSSAPFPDFFRSCPRLTTLCLDLLYNPCGGGTTDKSVGRLLTEIARSCPQLVHLELRNASHVHASDLCRLSSLHRLERLTVENACTLEPDSMIHPSVLESVWPLLHRLRIGVCKRCQSRRSWYAYQSECNKYSTTGLLDLLSL